MSIIDRVDAGEGERVEAGPRLEAELVGPLLAHDQHGRGAVGDLRAVAGGHLAVFLERRLELGQRLDGGARADALVGADHLVALDDVAGLRSNSFALTGMISFSKRPSLVAGSASCWLRAANASRSSRERSHLSAMISAEVPCVTSPPRSA